MAFVADPRTTKRDTEAADHAAWYDARPWTRFYPPGMPSALDARTERTALDLLLSACARYPERIAFELEGQDGESLTFGEWHRRSDALARFFVHEWGLRKGDRILFMMPNVPAYPVAFLAAWMAGLVVTAVYAAATAHELEGVLRGIVPRAVVGLDALMPTLRQARGSADVRELVATASPGANAAARDAGHSGGSVLLDDAVAAGALMPPIACAPSPGDPALLIYTGGTTGVPKAVRTPHAALRFGVDVLATAIDGHIGYSADSDDVVRPPVISIHPFAHTAGLSLNLLHYASRGFTQVLFPQVYDTARVVESWKRRPYLSLLAGPAFFGRLLATPGFGDVDFSALRMGATGGMAPPVDVLRRWQEATGRPLIQGYGLTEVSAPVIVETGSPRRLGSAGRPLPSVECSVRDADSADARAVAPGELGELWLRGRFLMHGYDQRPDETARVLTPDGWLRTGDLARIDETGAVHIAGRLKDVIIVDGANVHPGSIEQTVVACPGVADACVVGMPDETDGERVRLFVVRRDPALDEATVAAWCRERLSHFKQPKRIEFVDALPYSPAGKLLRRELALRPLA